MLFAVAQELELPQLISKAIVIHSLRKEKKRKDSAGSDDTASMIKGLCKRQIQPVECEQFLHVLHSTQPSSHTFWLRG